LHKRYSPRWQRTLTRSRKAEIRLSRRTLRDSLFFEKNESHL
jgi:hypothetical protein